jgi:hypothetical protein
MKKKAANSNMSETPTIRGEAAPLVYQPPCSVAVAELQTYFPGCFDKDGVLIIDPSEASLLREFYEKIEALVYEGGFTTARLRQMGVEA